MKKNTFIITGSAMTAAIAYVVMLAGFRFMPTATFLKYEAKEVVLTIGGYVFGPLAAVASAFVVSLIEMVTVSESGPIGFIMNFVAASSYTFCATYAYFKNRSVKGAVIGLAVGSAALCAVMLLWNYIVTPIYMNVPRPVVANMLLPVFLPFNLIKAGLNSGIILLVYKPLMSALRSARLLPRAVEASGVKSKDGGEKESAGVSDYGASGGAQYRLNAKLFISAAALLLLCIGVIIFLNLHGQ